MKEEFEIEKLQLEIKELQRPIWLKPGFITPVIAAILSIVVAYTSGWFDVNLVRLENERSKLQSDIAKFETSKKELENSVDILASKNLQLESQEKNVRQERDNLEEDIIRLRHDFLQDMTEATSGSDFVKGQIQLLEESLKRATELGLDTAGISETIDAAKSNLLTLSQQEDLIWQQLQKSGILDDDGCFVDDNGEQHCTNF